MKNGKKRLKYKETTRTYFNRHPQYFVKGTLTRLLSKSHRFLSICVLNISFRVVTTGMTEMQTDYLPVSIRKSNIKFVNAIILFIQFFIEGRH